MILTTKEVFTALDGTEVDTEEEARAIAEANPSDPQKQQWDLHRRIIYTEET